MNHADFKCLCRYLHDINLTHRMTEKQWQETITMHRIDWVGYCSVKNLPHATLDQGIKHIVRYISTNYHHLVDYE